MSLFGWEVWPVTWTSLLKRLSSGWFDAVQHGHAFSVRCKSTCVLSQSGGTDQALFGGEHVEDAAPLSLVIADKAKCTDTC
jgi:hypothetical protein